MIPWQTMLAYISLVGLAIAMHVAAGRLDRRGQVVLRGLAFALGYFAINQLSYATYFGPIGEDPGTMWLSSGYLIGCLLVVPRRWYWAMVAVAACTRLTSGELLQQLSWQVNLFWTLANCTEGVIGSYVLLWWLGRKPDINRPKDLMWFSVVSVLFATAVSATIGTLVLHFVFHQQDVMRNWQDWWFSNVIGVLGLGKCLLAWFEPNPDSRRADLRGRSMEFGGLLLLLVVVSAFTIGPYQISMQSVLDFPYLVLPGLVWAGLRFSARLASTAALAVALVAIFTANGSLDFLPAWTPMDLGPFRSEQTPIRTAVLAIQAFLLVTLFATPLLAAITRERERAEQRVLAVRDQLYRAQQSEAVAQLARGVAHDVNNLLAVIQAHRDQVSERVKQDPGLSESLDAMADASAQATTLSRTLLDLGAQHDLQFGKVNLPQVVRDAVQSYRQLLPARVSVELAVNPAQPLYVMADAGQLQQVLLNLIVNARDAMHPAGGKLRVSVRPDREHQRIILEVADTGCGIDPDIRDRLFEPLFTTKPHGQGTGLGLPIVRSIVDAHGGDIEVHSTPGQGATFTVNLPSADGPATTPTPRHLTAAGIADPTRKPVCLLQIADPQVEGAIRSALVHDGWRAARITDETELARAPGKLCVIDAELLAAIPGVVMTRPTIVLGQPDHPLSIEIEDTYILHKPFRINDLVIIAAKYKMG